jgi:hypothetical protein
MVITLRNELLHFLLPFVPFISDILLVDGLLLASLISIKEETIGSLIPLRRGLNRASTRADRRCRRSSRGGTGRNSITLAFTAEVLVAGDFINLHLLVDFNFSINENLEVNLLAE